MIRDWWVLMALYPRAHARAPKQNKALDYYTVTVLKYYLAAIVQVPVTNNGYY